MTSPADPVRYALGTYTRIPVPAPRALDATTAGRGLALGPLVGAGLGLASGALLMVTGVDLVARLLSATLVVALAAWLTRGLHWDGLADVADGLGSGAPPDRARDIMRRSDIGPFGVLAVVFTIALQVLSLAQLPAGGPALAGWVLAVAMGRFAVALACGPWARPAAPSGLGALVVGAVTPRRLAAATALAAGVGGVVCVGGEVAWPLAVLLAPAAAAATAGYLTHLASRRLGGSTGDVLGATAELATTSVLLVLALR
jgi:adenosylcobinamide-GDP ribazoletransferase